MSTFDELADLKKSFTYHAPTEGQPEVYEALRSQALLLALHIFDVCPPSRERSMARTKLEEAIMWANKSIACNGLNPDYLQRQEQT